MPLSAVQAQVATEISLLVDEKTSIAGLDGSAQLQLGGMRCVWAGANRTDTSYDDGLQLDIVPNAVAEFATASSDSSFDGMSPLEGLGDEAYQWCDASSRCAVLRCSSTATA